MLATKLPAWEIRKESDIDRMQISIPDVFRTVNTLRRYPDDWRAKNFYNGVASRGGRAGDCIGCGQCEGVCPQHLPIIELLKEASGILD